MNGCIRRRINAGDVDLNLSKDAKVEHAEHMVLRSVSMVSRASLA